ncbi:MAG TPA: type II toxin-antitoxin system HicB family antitoxin [Anaerolineae bacterium]|nr:type II toxin-antitoxin system HicB family antitoxin [Anaerolineae bacterium]
MSEKNLDYYLSLPYRIEIYPDDGGYTAAIPDLPGCITCGETLAEALELIEDAKAGWLELALADGDPIPEPLPAEAVSRRPTYSGKFTVRLPKSLHQRLAERARDEGVSLNQFVNVALTQAITGQQYTRSL